MYYKRTNQLLIKIIIIDQDYNFLYNSNTKKLLSKLHFQS